MHDLLVYLLAMVIVVPLSKRVGLGAVLGYLFAGALIGPHGFALLENPGSANGGVHEDTIQLAELGVIMMLLLIGLELNPRRLWTMRGPIIGLGFLQVVATIVVFFVATRVLGVAIPAALVIGMVVSVSSTAIVLQTLQERGYAKSTGGERALAVLLFQDIAVIPMLAALPLLGAAGGTATESSPVRTALLILGAVGAIGAAGRFVIRPVFKFLALMRLRETFTALALLIVVGATALMHSVGLSPALGAFLAGVVLADSEYRHQIEADIEPFKGLLLGLFFITVGASIRFGLVVEQPLVVAGWVAAIVLGKAAIVYAIGRASKIRPPESLLFAAALAQGGEFAFVLLAQSGGILSPEATQILTASVALSMALAPLLIGLTIQYGMSRLDCVVAGAEERLPDTVDESEKDNPVLVVGIGRFGQTFVRFLRANDFTATVLDIDSEQIDVIARFGIKSYFGDGSNLDLLRAAGLERAKAIVLAIDEPETAARAVEEIRRAYPKLPIFARAYDRLHAYRLIHLGVTEVAIETSGSALGLGVEVLKALGVPAERALRKARLFQENNQRSIWDLSKLYRENDQETFIQATRQASEQLEALLRSDPEELARGASSDWTPGARPPEAGVG